MSKCVAGPAVVYTDAECPAGSQPQPLSGGTVSVLPARAVDAPASGHAAARSPHVRDLLVKPDKPDAASLRDQRMDAIIGK